MTPNLPINDALPDLIAALSSHGRAVLQAPPGAGKTTRVPLAMLDANLCAGRILMLEPRRLATRAAAERMAQTLGEPVGQTVGYRMRGDSKTSRQTRIEVVTEGILTRMIQTNPDLPGIGAVVFDEFHERSLNADLGLALCLEIASVLREDLMLLVMSATLDAEPVATLMNAPIITSQGRAFDVDYKWLPRPLDRNARLEQSTADLVVHAVNTSPGSALVFLPGEGEIRRVETALSGRLPSDCTVRPLFGAMPFAAQRAAIAPVTQGRKIVLATSIAETSLTIEDVRIVVDAGRSRRARFDPGSAMSRLVTERVTRAEATQRAGRAGRVSTGVCYKLWTKGEDGGMAAFPPAEIEAADLTGLALELALWGAHPKDLSFLTQPNPNGYSEAQALLQMLGALDANHRITDHGKHLARLPLHPRIANMLAKAGDQAALFAALLADRDPMPRSAGADLALRMHALKGHDIRADRGGVERVKTEAKRLAKQADKRPETFSLAEMAAFAYPDRIAQRRKGDAPRYLLANGKGAYLDDADPLTNQPFLVATDLDGDPREAKVRLAVPITTGEIKACWGDQVERVKTCNWPKRDARIVARIQERIGAAVLDARVWKDVPPDMVAHAMLEGVRELGLFPSPAASRFLARVRLVPNMPDVSTETLMTTLDEWLLPHLAGIRTAAEWKRFDLLEPLRALLSWEQMRTLDSAAPAHFTTPLGRKTPIDYDGDTPSIDIRLQEMFGVTRHPMIGSQPLRITLLSPAQRPVQTTMDIPGFWANSYSDVRKDMRGRYPRHPWPEDPTQADPTLRAKPRGT